MISQYVLYKGDELIAMGTAKELAELLNVNVKTIHFYATPTSIKRSKGNRKVVVKVDD